MNKYEKFYVRTAYQTEYVLAYILSSTRRYSGAWCGIDEFIDNPAIFPEQDLPLAVRKQWAIDRRDSWGARFIITKPSNDGRTFALAAMNSVPSMQYRHINKVWGNASEQV